MTRSGRAKRATWPATGALLLMAVALYRGWFKRGIITFGDWSYYAPATLRDLARLPLAWEPTRSLGGPNSLIYLSPYEAAYGVLGQIGVSFAGAERLLTFLPAALLPLFSMFLLSGRFTASSGRRLLSATAFGLNTYIIGEQNQHMLIAIVYGLAPIAIYCWVRVLDAGSNKTRWAVLTAVSLSVALALDARITLLTAMLCLFLTFGAVLSGARMRELATPAFTVIILTVGAHAYWILPVFVGGTGSFSGLLPPSPFVSWATLSHAFALNDPFWTGNAAKYFEPQPLSWPLMLLPAAAFLTLLARRAGVRRPDWRVAVFGLSACLGVFLVKGEQPPLAQFYGWAFANVPGMQLFRDMSKFNLWVAVGYAVLLAAGGPTTDETFPARRLKQAVAIAAFLSIGWGARPLISQEMEILKPVTVPTGFVATDTILDSDREFGRVLWLPREPRFSSRSRLHPIATVNDILDAVPASDLRAKETGLLQPPGESPGSETLERGARAFGVRYIAVVNDGELPSMTITEIELLSRLAIDADVILQDSTITLYRLRRAVKPVSLVGRGSLTSTGDPGGDRRFIIRQPGNRVTVIAAHRFDPNWKASLTAVGVQGRLKTTSGVGWPTPEGSQAWSFVIESGVTLVRGHISYGPQRLAVIGIAISGLFWIMTALLSLATAHQLFGERKRR